MSMPSVSGFHSRIRKDFGYILVSTRRVLTLSTSLIQSNPLVFSTMTQFAGSSHHTSRIHHLFNSARGEGLLAIIYPLPSFEHSVVKGILSTRCKTHLRFCKACRRKNFFYLTGQKKSNAWCQSLKVECQKNDKL